MAYALGLVLSAGAALPIQHHLYEVLVGLGIAGTGFGVVLAVVGRASLDEKRSMSLAIASTRRNDPAGLSLNLPPQLSHQWGPSHRHVALPRRKPGDVHLITLTGGRNHENGCPVSVNTDGRFR